MHCICCFKLLCKWLITRRLIKEINTRYLSIIIIKDIKIPSLNMHLIINSSFLCEEASTCSSFYTLKKVRVRRKRALIWLCTEYLNTTAGGFNENRSFAFPGQHHVELLVLQRPPVAHSRPYTPSALRLRSSATRPYAISFCHTGHPRVCTVLSC